MSFLWLGWGKGCLATRHASAKDRCLGVAGDIAMTEKVERIARTALWITLALVFVAIPIGVAKSQSNESAARAEAKAELKKAEDKIAELTKPKDPELFPAKDMGMFLSGLRYSAAEGLITFTNATPKGGMLCLKGVAKNVKSGAVSESIATCKEIKPYDSNVRLVFSFASGDLHKVCAQEGDCDFNVASVVAKNEPQKEAAPAAEHP